MIIQSLFDCDTYKINMQRIFVEKFFNSYGRYVFKCRTPNIKFTQAMFNDIFENIEYVTGLRFTEENIDYIKGLKYHSNAYGYLNFLKMFKLDMSNFRRLKLLDDGSLAIEVEGPIYQVSMWEIFILAIVQEVYWQHTCHPKIEEFQNIGIEKLQNDIEALNGEYPTLIEFGTRRRFTKQYQRQVLRTLLRYYPNLFGTSNLSLAKEFNLRPIGTHAHEYICLGQALKHVPLSESQIYMLDQWYELYGDHLGYALTDTLGDDKFFKDFTAKYAKLFDGVRHDSGPPINWANRIIDHYTKMGVDYKDKYLMFSDSITLEKALEIKNYLKQMHDHDKVSFGIGTALTNNIPGIQPLNCVMKLVEANGRPVAKLSNDAGKIMCTDEKYIEYLRYTIK